jgi:hypothetical protein
MTYMTFLQLYIFFKFSHKNILVWIRIGSRFNNRLDPDPDILLDPVPYSVNEDPKHC